MKTTKAIAICMLVLACLLSSSCEPGYDRGRNRFNEREAERSLIGNWNVNGDSNKRAEIVLAAGGLEARNENGDTSRLEVVREGYILALDWGSLRGDELNGRIDWANGTTWTRESPPR